MCTHQARVFAKEVEGSFVSPVTSLSEAIVEVYCLVASCIVEDVSRPSEVVADVGTEK